MKREAFASNESLPQNKIDQKSIDDKNYEVLKNIWVHIGKNGSVKKSDLQEFGEAFHNYYQGDYPWKK